MESEAGWLASTNELQVLWDVAEKEILVNDSLWPKEAFDRDLERLQKELEHFPSHLGSAFLTLFSTRLPPLHLTLQPVWPALSSGPSHP